MSIVIGREAIEATTPALRDAINWDQVTAALVINFTNRNTGDLHIDVREANGYNPGSHKTHIDVTSGDDIDPGLSPVTDFFDTGNVPRTYPARMSVENIASLWPAPLNRI